MIEMGSNGHANQDENTDLPELLILKHPPIVFIHSSATETVKRTNRIKLYNYLRS